MHEQPVFFIQQQMYTKWFSLTLNISHTKEALYVPSSSHVVSPASIRQQLFDLVSVTHYHGIKNTLRWHY